MGKDDSQTHPVKLTVEVDEARITVEASREETALALARQFIAAHPAVAARATAASKVKVKGQVPHKPRRRRK